MLDKMYSFTNALSAAAVTPSLLPTETERDREVRLVCSKDVLCSEANIGGLQFVLALLHNIILTLLWLHLYVLKISAVYPDSKGMR